MEGPLSGAALLSLRPRAYSSAMAQKMRRKNVGKRPVPNRKKAAAGGRKSSRKGVKNGSSRKRSRG